MRERLTIAFIAVTLVLVVAVVVIRSYAVSSAVRESRSDDLHSEAMALASAIDARARARQPVDRTYLAGLVAPDARVVYHIPGRADLSAKGPDFTGDLTPSTGDLWAVADTTDGQLTVTESGREAPILTLGHPTTLLLLLLVVLAAGLLGYLVARMLSAPFRQLAVAAEALGRGRFHLDLPRTRIPEARAISTALEQSSTRLEERLNREQRLAEHASHVLRTPLTSLRLELEDLAQRPDIGDGFLTAVDRCVQRIDQLDAVTGELVELARDGSLVSGAEIPLRELATASTQRWADELAQHDRRVTASLEGDLEAAYTPGPVEQILDLVLLDVVHRTRGPVRMLFESGPDGHLRMEVCWAVVIPRPRTVTSAAAAPLVRARAVAMALGGRLEEAATGDSLWVRLPRR